MPDSSCIFCRIAQGVIPSLRIFENEDCLAFLDVGPLADGHTLLIPRRHFRDIRDIDPASLARTLSIVPSLARAIMEITGATGLNLLQNTGASSGQAVFHVHFHLIPRVEGDKLGYRWNAGKYPEGRADELRDRLAAAIHV